MRCIPYLRSPVFPLKRMDFILTKNEFVPLSYAGSSCTITACIGIFTVLYHIETATAKTKLFNVGEIPTENNVHVKIARNGPYLYPVGVGKSIPMYFHFSPIDHLAKNVKSEITNSPGCSPQHRVYCDLPTQNIQLFSLRYKSVSSCIVIEFK
jgi:hypothetical protein